MSSHTPIVGCAAVGLIKCYAGLAAGGTHPVGGLSYMYCPEIDGVLANAGHLGATVRHDNSFSDIDSDVWTVYSVDLNTAANTLGASLTTNATCTPPGTSGNPNYSCDYTWEQVRVRIPDGYNQDGTSKWKYRAFIFSPLYYKAKTTTAPHTTSYPSQLAEGNFSITRGGTSWGDNSWFHRVAYLFADEDAKYPIHQKTYPPHYGGTVPDVSWNVGPTEDGPDNPATANTNMDPAQAGVMSGNDPGMPFSMWSPGMPMEGVFPEVGDIVKITDLRTDYRDSVWYNTSTPWNHVLPVQDPCPGEYHWITTHTGCGTHMSRNPYQTWAGGVNSHIDWPAGTITPNQDQLCLQVIAVITEAEFNSNNTFLPSQTQPVQSGPGYSPLGSSSPNTHTCYNLGVEGCHYRNRANNTRAGVGNRQNNNTPCAQGGVGHITLYMKPNPNWIGIYNMGIVDQEIGNVGDAECYDVCAYMVDEDHTFPEIPSTGWNSHTYRQWNPRLDDEGPNHLPGTDDCCNIHCPVTRFTQLHHQPSWTKGYKVPYDGRYIIHYEAEVYQSHGNAWSDPSHWNAWVTIDRQIVSWGNQPVGIKYTNPNVWYDGPCAQGGTSYLPTLPPFNATWTSAGPGNYCAHWYASNSNGVYKYGDLEYEIDLKKGMEIQIVLKGRNSAFAHTNYGRIRKQEFRVYPKPGIVLVGPFGNSVVVMNDLPPPGALCFCTPKTQTWQGHPQYGGTANQNNDGILAEPGHDWDCVYCSPAWSLAFPHKACCTPYWTGTTTICESKEECLRIPSWNCDLSLSYLPVTIDPDGTGEWWRIEGGGCVDPGDGSGTYKSFSGNSYSNPSCIEQCNQPWWSCDGNGSCTEYTTVAPVNAYLTQVACLANCVVASWDCDMTQGLCYDPGTGNGQYTSLANCNIYCHATTYNCGDAVGGNPGVCYQSNGPNGQYLTLAACQSNCFPDSYNCVNNSCVDPGDGTGVFPLLSTCKDICSPKVICDTYFAVSNDGTLQNNNPQTTIWEKELYYYDSTTNSTTYVLDLPLDIIPSSPTDMQKLDTGIANTETKLWAWGYNASTTTEAVIFEYDIITPTSLTYNRTIQGIPIAGLNIGSLSAINNKTLISLSSVTSTEDAVIEIDVHPVTGPSITEKFRIDTVDIGDTLFWRKKDVLFTTAPMGGGLGNFGKINKYDYITGTLLNSVDFIPNPGGDLGVIRGLAMNNGNLYAYHDVLSNRKYLINKQTLAQTYMGWDIGNVPVNQPYAYWPSGQGFGGPSYAGTSTLHPWVLPHQGGIVDASSSPCCDNDNLSNCGGCMKTLEQYMPSSGVNFIPYYHTMPYIQYGWCVSDPGGCCYCCTYSNAPSLAPPSNSSSRLYATTLNYVEGISKTNEKVSHLEEIKRWFTDPVNLYQDTVWNTIYFAKRNNEYEKGECGDDFEAISLFSLTISVNGKSHTFDDTSTWSDVIKHSISLGARVDKSMTWDKYIKIMYSSFGVNEFSYSASENSCGCYNDETSGPNAKEKNVPCCISNGNYIDITGKWRECEVDIHGDSCTGDTMNWGCCGGNMLPSLYINYVCDNRQSICPSGCAKIDTGYVGYDTESFFAWYTQISNGFYAVDIRTIKYILNNLPNQVSYPCYETGVGWWYNHQDQFGIAWTSTTGTVTAHFQSYGTSWFSTWLDFITALFSNNFATANLGLTFNQLLNYPYQLLMNKLQLIQPGFALHIYGRPCMCDGVECVQNVPKPDGYLTKDECQNSYLRDDCPNPISGKQRCTTDPWRCTKKQIPSQSNIPQYKCYCVQDGGGNYNTITYATEELCKEAQNCCLPETYNCKTSESNCVGRNLLPQIVGRWWDGVQATNTITATPVATSTELFANAIFGLQSTDIRTVRWEYSLLPANTISSWDCLPTSQLSVAWAGAPWITVTGLEFKDPFETTNINNTMGLPGLPVYTWSDYISLLNSYGVGTLITPSMSAGQVGSIIENYMGWDFVTFGVSWRRCVCDIFTTNCFCTDPGDGSGTYSSLYGCQTAPFSCCGAPPI